MTKDLIYKTGADALRTALKGAIRELLRPQELLTLSQWAEKYAYLSRETSASAGKYHAYQYQVGMMDAITDPTISKITVMKSARVGYTCILDHVLGYYTHHDPSPILVVQPREEDAEDYSRREVAPMFRNTPVLTELQGEVRDKDPNHRITQKNFRNGSSITLVGANSAAAFRRLTVRIVAFDEVDAYPHDVDNEGDQISLGTKRAETYWNRKIILGSTPKIKAESRIERSFKESDQRYYFVPCPHCGHKQVLKWENMHWDKEVDDNGKTIAHKPETAYFVCEESGCIIEEHNKHWMIKNGEWIATQPSKGHAGFFIWTAYSLFSNAAWGKLAAEFLEKKSNPSELKTFVNTVLGETWEEQGEGVEHTGLAARAENYDGDTLPSRVRIITAGVDVQDNRLEVQYVGWGAKEESWVIATEVLHGDPAGTDLWDSLDGMLGSTFRREDGTILRIKAACIDTGGHHTERVYAFTKKRHACNVFAIKGMAGSRPVWPLRHSNGGVKGNDKFFLCGVDTAKDAIYGRLRIKEPGPGYIHFPAYELDDDYYTQLTSEHVQTRYQKGKPYRVWVLPSGKHNESLDTFVYALAAMKSTGIRLDRYADDTPDTPAPSLPAPLKPIAGPPGTPTAPTPPPPPAAPTGPRRPTGWFGANGGQTGRRGWLG